MIYLHQFIVNEILNRHTDSPALVYRINFNFSHTEQISLYPLMKGMFSCPCGTAAIEPVNSLCFLVQSGHRNLIIFWNFLKQSMFLVPNPKMFIIRLVSPKIGAGKIHIFIKIGIYDVPIQENIGIRRQGLKRFVHGVRVPDSKLYSGAANLCRCLFV